jgi:hypothetical protein
MAVEQWINGRWIVSTAATPIADIGKITHKQLAEVIKTQIDQPLTDLTTGKVYKVIADNGMIGIEEV